MEKMMVSKRDVFISLGIVILISVSMMLFLCSHFLLSIYYFNTEYSANIYFMGSTATASIAIDSCLYLAIALLLASILLIGFSIISRGK